MKFELDVIEGKMKRYYGIYQTPISQFLYVYTEKNELIKTDWLIKEKKIDDIKYKKWDLLEDQLEKYFRKEIKEFNVETFIDHKLGAFTKKVINNIMSIPYGNVITYKELSQIINTKAYQAVGNACRSNPLPLIIPCHRVVASNGIGGYSGKNKDSIELNIKKYLLEHEGVVF